MVHEILFLELICFARVPVGHLVQLVSEALVQRHPLVFRFLFGLFLPLHVEHALLIKLLDRVFSDPVDFFQRDAPLILVLFLFSGRQAFNNNCGGVYTCRNVFDVMVQFKLRLRVRRLDEGALAVPELAQLIVSPHEECAIFESSHAKSASTGNFLNKQGFLVLVNHIKELGNVLNQSKVIQVGNSVDSQLALQIVPT